jgi:hypothetical protein
MPRRAVQDQFAHRLAGRRRVESMPQILWPVATKAPSTPGTACFDRHPMGPTPGDANGPISLALRARTTAAPTPGASLARPQSRELKVHAVTSGGTCSWDGTLVTSRCETVSLCRKALDWRMAPVLSSSPEGGWARRCPTGRGP